MKRLCALIVILTLLLSFSACSQTDVPAETEPAAESVTLPAMESVDEVATEDPEEPQTKPATEAPTASPTEPATEAPTDPPEESATEPEEKLTDSPKESDGCDYVLNTNTEKFHYPSCSSVEDIKPSNRQDYCGTREEVIEMGFDPCKRCNP